MPGKTVQGPVDPAAGSAGSTVTVRVVAWRDLFEPAEWAKLLKNMRSFCLCSLPHKAISGTSREWGKQVNAENE
eukprot:1380412-Alexandrium_andersonii.AAC.1